MKRDELVLALLLGGICILALIYIGTVTMFGSTGESVCEPIAITCTRP